jgi:acyl-CoA dehydrogenase
MERSLYSEEHEIFRTMFRTFLEKEVIPHQEQWREDGQVARDIWNKAGEHGFLCTWMGEEYGGPGADLLCSMVIIEELAKIYESGWGIWLHSDIVVPYIHDFGTEEQKQRWLPGCASGELVTAVAMTEPGTGSDLTAIQTRAIRDGDHYVINGAKTFISNGISCDLAIVAARTGDDDTDPHGRLSLFVIPADTPGFKRGRKLAKMGMMSQDTSELFFEDCRIPVDHLLGGEGAGFMMLMKQLQQERLTLAMSCQEGAAQVLRDTLAYCQEREAFGRPISKFQNTRFKLVECATEVEVGQAFIDKLVAEHVAGKYLVKECSMAKIWHSEMLCRVVDTCLQFFGGYGYMLEYPIARAYMDARVTRIFAGTNEIMKTIVAKQMGL